MNKRYQIVVIEGYKPRRISGMTFNDKDYAMTNARILKNTHPSIDYEVYEIEEGIHYPV